MVSYGDGRVNYKDRLWQPKCNILRQEPCLYFKEKSHWCSLSICKGYDWRQEGVSRKGGHFGECYRCINKIYEHGKVLPV